MNPVREKRMSMFMTQADLAAKSGVSLRTIVSIEKGHNCRVWTKRVITRAFFGSDHTRTQVASLFPMGRMVQKGETSP